jgi:octopine/nopaline transport system substrate-binding protein
MQRSEMHPPYRVVPTVCFNQIGRKAMASLRFFAAVAAIGTACLLLGGPTAEAKDLTKLTIATQGDFPPYMKIAPDGTKTGLEADLFVQLCKRMRVECAWTVEENDDAVILGLTGGKYDAILAAMLISTKDKGVVYSVPYAVIRVTFMLRKTGAMTELADTGSRIVLDDSNATKAAISTLATELKGKSIGTLDYPPLVAVLDKYLKNVSEIRTFATRVARDAELKAGHIDVGFDFYTQCLISLNKPGGDTLKLAGPALLNGPLGPGIGVALRDSDPELKAKFDSAIKDTNADGTLKALFLKWFHVDWSPPM